MFSSRQRTKRKTVSAVIAGAVLLASLTACSSSVESSESPAREASSQTGRMKLCVKNGTGSEFQLAWEADYLDENNQTITAREVAVPAEQQACVFSPNDNFTVRTILVFRIWRDVAAKSRIEVWHLYNTVDVFGVAKTNTQDIFVSAGKGQRTLEWDRGSLFASYPGVQETYAAGTANLVPLEIHSLW